MAGGRAVVDRSDVLMAVWDGQPARGLAGTADVGAYARERGVPVEVIWPEGATGPSRLKGSNHVRIPAWPTSVSYPSSARRCR
jgi:hypothetical protein